MANMSTQITDTISYVNKDSISILKMPCFDMKTHLIFTQQKF